MSEEDEVEAMKQRHEAEDQHDTELAAYLHRIGARSLAAELSDLRFRNRLLESQRWLDFHDARMSYEEQLHDKVDQRLMSNQSFLFDKATTYTNFVVTLGYAGFFAIWSIVKNFMHPWDAKLIALLLGVSLLIFITWTLITLVSSGRAVMRLAAALRNEVESNEARIEAITAAELVNLQRGLRLQRYWLPTFSISVFTGFAAGMILLLILLSDLLGMGISVHALFFGAPTVVPSEVPIILPSGP